MSDQKAATENQAAFTIARGPSGTKLKRTVGEPTALAPGQQIGLRRLYGDFFQIGGMEGFDRDHELLTVM